MKISINGEMVEIGNGPPGPPGKQGEQGIQGVPGENGSPGEPGKNAQFFNIPSVQGTLNVNDSIYIPYTSFNVTPEIGKASGFINIDGIDYVVGGNITELKFINNVNNAKFTLTSKNRITGPSGNNGEPGTSAGFGTPTATVDNNTGTPSVTVTASGPNTAKVFNFEFSGLKGESGSSTSTNILVKEPIDIGIRYSGVWTKLNWTPSLLYDYKNSIYVPISCTFTFKNSLGDITLGIGSDFLSINKDSDTSEIGYCSPLVLLLKNDGSTVQYIPTLGVKKDGDPAIYVRYVGEIPTSIKLYDLLVVSF